MLPSLFVFLAMGCGWGREWGIWYFIQLQCTHSNVKFKGYPQCSTVQSFMLVIKNNEAVLVIKWSAASNNKMTCAQSEDSSVWASAQSSQSLCYPTEGSLGHKLPIQRTMTLIRLRGCLDCPESSLCANVSFFVLSCSGSNVKWAAWWSMIRTLWSVPSLFAG